MGHGLLSTDGMFTVREAPWHDLGVVFENYPTRKQAQSIAHPWEPLRDDLWRKVPVLDDRGVQMVRLLDPVDGMPGGLVIPLDRVPTYTDPELGETTILAAHESLTTDQKVTGWYANVRSDNGAELGVVTEKYVTVTNAELWDIAESIEQSGSDVMYETGGSLRGGAQVWVLVRLAEPLEIKGDPRGETIPYFALQNTHDGTGAFRGQATMTRIVCMNTSMAADWDARRRGTEFQFKHTKNVSERIGQAREALSGWRQAIEDWKDQAEYLITLAVTDKAVGEFLDRYIPMPPKHLITDRVEANIKAERSKWLGGYRSITGEGIEGTAYGLVQASTEYANWARAAHTAESRFRRTFLSTDVLVARAIEFAVDAAGVDDSRKKELVLA